jgi:hypothetical protein
MYLKISAMNEFFNPKVGLRALFSGPHWLAPYRAAAAIKTAATTARQGMGMATQRAIARMARAMARAARAMAMATRVAGE